MINKPLRPYQEDAVNAITKDFDAGHKKCALIQPTGGGKTRVFNELIKRHTDKKPDALVLVVSHLSLLVTQSQKSLNDLCPDIKTGTLQAKCIPGSKAKVAYATIQSARELPKIKRWLRNTYGKEREVSLVIIDESHKSQCESYEKLIKHVPDAYYLFCTATPYKESQTMLPYFGKVSHTISTQELIDLGFLVPPVLKQILMKGYEVEDRIAQVVELYKREEFGQQSIVFMKTMVDCRLCRNAFEKIGVRAAAVNCDTATSERDGLLDKFRNCEIQVLITCSVLSEGFDAPVAEVCFMPYSTSSVVKYLQTVGRFLRLSHGKVDARIYAFGDAPSIKKGLYKKMHGMAMNKGGKLDPDIFSDLEYMDIIGESKSSSTYLWTQEICDVAARIEDLGAFQIYDLVRTKQFPQRFLKNLGLLKSGLDICHVTNKDAVTSKQATLLKHKGFSDAQISQLSKGDASSLIAITNKIVEVNAGGSVIASGKFLGTEIPEIPWAYRKIAFSSRGKGDAYKQIREFYRKRKLEEKK